jgi:hypothetical protein
MKRITLFAMGLVISLTAHAQGVETSIGADIVSSYIWRGQDLGSTAIQPTLGIEYKGLSFSACGSYALVDPFDTKEFDLTLGYTVGGFNIGITDYWFSKGLDPEGRYFKYAALSTNHIFEANVGYDFGFASLQWFTNFAGNDGKYNEKRAYSSYFEISIPFKLVSVDWAFTAGAVPYATDFYGTTGFAVTNLTLSASKDIKVTDSFTIPVFAQLVANPCSQKAYLVLGFTLQP